MKNIIKIIIISLVILGMVAAYVFTGVTPISQPQPAPEDPTPDEPLPPLNYPAEFQGPTGEPNTSVPSGQPNIQGPSAN